MEEYSVDVVMPQLASKSGLLLESLEEHHEDLQRVYGRADSKVHQPLQNFQVCPCGIGSHIGALAHGEGQIMGLG